MKYFKKIEGKKLYLSPVNPEDVGIYTKWVNDLSMSIRLGSASNVYSLQQEKSFLESMAKEGHNFAIILKDSDKLIGNGSLFSVNNTYRSATLGLFIGDEENRNKGLGTEALQLLTEYGFKILNLNNIMLQVFEFNKAAIKCYEKAGFRTFGKRTMSCCINGKYYDEYYMEILPKDIKSTFLDEFLP
ncbi:UNVERIFIED_CONTAM: RimJ/RimL family protein N-acetyltransferase [Acetivibrio alkalicellulosi]